MGRASVWEMKSSRMGGGDGYNVNLLNTFELYT